jgi:hypothetical protein
MPVFAMARRLLLRGLTGGGPRWWAVVVLAGALLGGIGGVADAATPTVSVTGVGTTTPVLRQAGSTWETTVLVTDTSGCAKTTTIRYWLAAMPHGASSDTTPLGPESPGMVAGATSDGSACEVTVTFGGLAQVPATAALVVDQSGTSMSVALTVSRDVTLASYLGLPAIAGGIAAGLYVLLLLFVTTYDWKGGRHYLVDTAWWKRAITGSGAWSAGGAGVSRYPVDTAWWKHPIAGSGAWSASDSWATNITTGLVVVSTFLAATTASSTLFPGVALDRFAIVNIVAGVFVVAAPVLFGILYVCFTGRDPGPSADSVVQVPRDKHVVVRVPSGATMTMVTKTTVSGDPGTASAKPGDSYQIAPGSVIAIKPDPWAHDANGKGAKIIAFSGTSDIGVLPGATVCIGPEREPENAGALPVSVTGADCAKFGGAKLTVTGTADVNLPKGAVITGPRLGESRATRSERWLLVPQGPTVIVGSLGVMVAANILTMFGIGAELGIAFVLARLSEAAGAGVDGIYVGLAALGGFVLWYAISATQAMANPQPGSALSAQAGTSFTL